MHIYIYVHVHACILTKLSSCSMEASTALLLRPGRTEGSPGILSAVTPSIPFTSEESKVCSNRWGRCGIIGSEDGVVTTNNGEEREIKE